MTRVVILLVVTSTGSALGLLVAFEVAIGPAVCALFDEFCVLVT